MWRGRSPFFPPKFPHLFYSTWKVDGKNRPYVFFFFRTQTTNLPFGIGILAIYFDLKVDDIPPPLKRSHHYPHNPPPSLHLPAKLSCAASAQEGTWDRRSNCSCHLDELFMQFGWKSALQWLGECSSTGWSWSQGLLLYFIMHRGEHVKHPNEVRNPSEVFMLLFSTLQLVGCSSAKKKKTGRDALKSGIPLSTIPPKTNMKDENHAFQKGLKKNIFKTSICLGTPCFGFGSVKNVDDWL